MGKEELCFICNTKDFIGGAAMTTYLCCNCGKKDLYGSTNTPKRCSDCSKRYHKCRRCENGLTPQVGIKYRIYFREFDGRKYKKLIKDCVKFLKERGWENIKVIDLKPSVYITVTSHYVNHQLYLPIDYMVEAKLFEIKP